MHNCTRTMSTNYERAAVRQRRRPRELSKDSVSRSTAFKSSRHVDNCCVITKPCGLSVRKTSKMKRDYQVREYTTCPAGSRRPTVRYSSLVICSLRRDSTCTQQCVNSNRPSSEPSKLPGQLLSEWYRDTT
jgi:hypothetical protein